MASLAPCLVVSTHLCASWLGNLAPVHLQLNRPARHADSIFNSTSSGATEMLGIQFEACSLSPRVIVHLASPKAPGTIDGHWKKKKNHGYYRISVAPYRFGALWRSSARGPAMLSVFQLSGCR
ncbi:hypothetical protein B0J15DRAFT_489541 [Fusarium solani]|uniref:Uncharacterized protein n=2 Tax=Fusarium solani TaxID=169388 RepID=A0A9P9HUR0_FUSSL|nr:uncharacterized protein B0J15DRAFT_489541 [Fusarium solani]KAH7263945.1 hypothetical protein B0J15DRAFT_489541 [Fusarium solani]